MAAARSAAQNVSSRHPSRDDRAAHRAPSGAILSRRTRIAFSRSMMAANCATRTSAVSAASCWFRNRAWPNFKASGQRSRSKSRWKNFAGRFGSRRARVKALLLDQSVLRGVGNIYADESLFRARIHPARIAASLTKKQLLALHRAVREILDGCDPFARLLDFGLRGFGREPWRISAPPSRLPARRESPAFVVARKFAA